jgi:arylsulfatase A-like enzyme
MIRNFSFRTLCIVLSLAFLLSFYTCGKKEETTPSKQVASESMEEPRPKQTDQTLEVTKEKSEPLNIILITVDSLRYDYLGCYGNQDIKTPAIDSLSSDGILFERCITPNPQDLPAYCALMTGIYPEKLGVYDNAVFKLPERFLTLAERFREEGFRTAGFIGSSVLERKFGLSQGFDDYFDHFDSLLTNTSSVFSERNAEEVMDHVLSYLKERDEDQDLFLWIHINDPNYGFDPPEPHEKSYKGEVEHTDGQIARLLSFLKDNGIYENTTMILTSDHGMALGDHNEKKYGIQLYESTVRVPLIIKPYRYFLSVEKKVSDITSLIDVAPSLLHLAGLGEIREEMDGHNLFEQPGEVYFSSALHQFFAFGWKIKRAVYHQGWKYIKDGDQELYSIDDDDKETTDYSERNRSLAELLKNKLDEFEKVLESVKIEDNRPIHDFMNSSYLRGLGYSWNSNRAFQDGRTGKYEVLTEIEDILEQAQLAILNKRPRASFRRMKSILDYDPENYTAKIYVTSSWLYNDREKLADTALSSLEDHYPHQAEIFHLKGHYIDIFEKNNEKALESWHKALDLDPLHSESYYDVACLYSLLNKEKEALKFLEKAIRAGYDNFNHMQQDTDLDNIRDTDQFKEILTKYQKQD